MKDDEILKIVLDLEIDNIRQQRDLFKHIAMLSSAIIGIFAFTKEQTNIELLSKIGIGGLFIVIIISVLLLYFSLKIDRDRMNRLQKLSSEVTELKGKTRSKIISQILTDSSINLLKDFLAKKSVSKSIKDRIINEINSVFAKSWTIVKLADQEIEKKKKIVTDNNDHLKDKLFNGISIVGVIIFTISLGFILFDIIF